jgi:hypothetical protein
MLRWPVRTASWRENQPEVSLQKVIQLSTIFYGSTHTRFRTRWSCFSLKINR